MMTVHQVAAALKVKPDQVRQAAHSLRVDLRAQGRPNTVTDALGNVSEAYVGPIGDRIDLWKRAVA